jgi:hypothetical protein
MQEVGMKTRWLVLLAWVVGGPSLSAQGSAPPPPVIDVHVHSTNTSPAQALERMKAHNVRFMVVSSLAADLPAWRAALPADQHLPGLVLPCPEGKAPITGRDCYATPDELPDLAWLRGELEAKRIGALAEALPQFLGLRPDDPRLEPYWQLAEELDVPVGLHLGTGPPGIAYPTGPVPVPFRSPRYRAAAGDPLALEEVLLRHPKLRLYVMHAGWPMLDSMMSLMHSHPQVHVDVAAIEATTRSRAGYLRYLTSLVDAGFGTRILFGSDFPNALAPGIQAILEAQALTPEQKADILCGNAQRFLRLPPATCAP